MIEYIDEIETEFEFENTLDCVSGAQMGSNNEKNWRSKIVLHTPINRPNHLANFRIVFQNGKFFFHAGLI